MTLYTFLLLAGIILAGLAFWQYKKTQNLLLVGAKVPATVVQLITVYDSEGDTYKPVFEYKTLEGETRRHTSNSASRPPSWKVGEMTELIYDPQNENRIKLVTYWGLYGWVIGLLLAASPFLVISLGYFLYVRGGDTVAPGSGYETPLVLDAPLEGS